MDSIVEKLVKGNSISVLIPFTMECSRYQNCETMINDALIRYSEALDKAAVQLNQDMSYIRDVENYYIRKNAGEFRDGSWLVIKDQKVLIHTSNEMDALKICKYIESLCVLYKVGNENACEEI